MTKQTHNINEQLHRTRASGGEGMSETKQEADIDAVKRQARWNSTKEFGCPIGVDEDAAFNLGFNAGYEAASRWQSIEKDGLPDEAGFYVAMHISNPRGAWERAWFNPISRGRVIEWHKCYTHYQKIEFQPEETTNDQ